MLGIVFHGDRNVQTISMDISYHEVNKSHPPVTAKVVSSGMGTLCLVSSKFSNLVVTATESITGRYDFSPHLLCHSVHLLYLITYLNNLPEPDCKTYS